MGGGSNPVKITGLIPDGVVHSESILVLINAIYFKGLWENEPEFHEVKGRKATVDVMYTEAMFRTCRSD